MARLERLSVLCGIGSLGSHWQSLEKYSHVPLFSEAGHYILNEIRMVQINFSIRNCNESS